MSLAFIRASQRICKYCKKEGHTKPNCPKAIEKCEEIIAGIRLIKHSGTREEEKLLDLFNSQSLTNLCTLMHLSHIPELLRLFLRNNNITEEESKMRYKRDRVKVLMLIFWFNSTAYKHKIARQSHKIVVKTLETVTDLTDFECPICVSCLPAKEKVETGCKHSVCKGCLIQYFEHQILHMEFSIPRCSMCRTNITELTVSNPEYLEEVESLADVM